MGGKNKGKKRGVVVVSSAVPDAAKQVAQ